MIVVGVCNSSFQASTQYAPFCHLWLDRLYSIFPHYPINGTIFGKNLWNINVCFDFLYNAFWNTSHSKNKWGRNYYKRTMVFTSNTHYYCHIWIKFYIIRLSFEKCSDTKLNENSFSGSRVVPCGWRDGRTDGRTDGHNTADSRLSRFANEPNKKLTSRNILVLHLTNCWHLHDIRIWNPIVGKV